MHISSIPINDFAIANEDGLVERDMELFYPCCGKSIICSGCVYSFCKSRNDKCPFCNADHADKTDGELVREMMKRVEANNDVGTICCELAGFYYMGLHGLPQDYAKATRNYMLGQQILVLERHISTWLTIIMRGEI
jgi:hypothetical protein